jgi:hypothetical protein
MSDYFSTLQRNFSDRIGGNGMIMAEKVQPA